MTEAGKALLDDLLALDKVQYQEGPVDFLGTVETELPAIEAEARAAVLRELREEVADLSEWLSTCRCFVINPKFGEGQPGGHFTDCAWAQESNVRDEILAAIDRRLGG